MGSFLKHPKILSADSSGSDQTELRSTLPLHVWHKGPFLSSTSYLYLSLSFQVRQRNMTIINLEKSIYFNALFLDVYISHILFFALSQYMNFLLFSGTTIPFFTLILPFYLMDLFTWTLNKWRINFNVCV